MARTFQFTSQVESLVIPLHLIKIFGNTLVWDGKRSTTKGKYIFNILSA